MAASCQLSTTLVLVCAAWAVPISPCAAQEPLPVHPEPALQWHHPGPPLAAGRGDVGPREAGLLEERLQRNLRGPATPIEVPLTPPPVDFIPWWQAEIRQPQRGGAEPWPVDLDALLAAALEFSPRVLSISETELIRRTALVEAEAEFDIKAFMESKFVRSSDPVGNDLTTGGPTQFRDSDWFYSGGARKRTRTGATLELSQRIGYRDNNSRFLNPTQQGNARLSLSFTQPLLNGAGRTYNHSRIVLAELDARAGRNEVVEGLQQHLVDVTRAYWDLYLRRVLFRQKQRHRDRAQEILRQLEDRRGVDSLQSQILSARAAVSARHVELNSAAAEISNAESRIRQLVSSPDFFMGGPQELIPSSGLHMQFVRVPLADAMATALYSRPDIDRALQETRMAAVRFDMSMNEMLPVLNLVLEAYVAGLEGQSRIGQAWENQFSRGEPGYTAGLLFEVPLWNRAAIARNERTKAELRRLTNALKDTVDGALLEVEIARRAVETAYRNIVGNFASMAASQAHVDYLRDRWSVLPGDDRSASFTLEDLLRAQDRLANSEFAFAESQVGYMLAQVELKQAMGILLFADEIAWPAPLPAAPLPAHPPHQPLE